MFEVARVLTQAIGREQPRDVRQLAGFRIRVEGRRRDVPAVARQSADMFEVRGAGISVVAPSATCRFQRSR
jgi:hypothetical protein